MAWTRTNDLDSFMTTAGDFLRTRSVEHTILLTVSGVLAASGPGTFGEQKPEYGWWRAPTGEIAGAYVWTPPRPVLISPLPAHAADALAGLLADGQRPATGVNGERSAADAFAAGWQRCTALTPRAKEDNRLYELGEPVPPDPAPAGRARVATTADRELLVRWWGAFARELGDGAGANERIVDDRISYGGVMLWEVAGEPVAFGGRTRPVAGMARIGPVYTPPDQRRKGYAAGVTTAVGQAATAAGTDRVLIFADLDNPTSTALYQRLGYRPVTDYRRYTFGLPDNFG